MVNLKVYVMGRPIGIISVLRQEGIPFIEMSGAGDVNSHINEGGVAIGTLAESTAGDLIHSSRYARVYKRGKGCYIHIDKRADEESRNQKPAMKEFITSAGTVLEKVALFSKKDIREEISEAVAAAFYIRSLPFIRIWYYPNLYRSLFNFRFDLDEDTGNDLEKIAEVSAGYKDCTSWFVCCASYEKNSYKIENLIKNGYDIQSHGYYHHTYSQKPQNDDNIDKSLRYFKKFGRAIEGFAAPKGKWNKGLQRALEERGFLYSSEFSLDYDNFPFYPVLESRFSSVLQIPIHPICWGLYRDAGIDNDSAIKEYMINAISGKYYYNLPIMIYGHPGEKISKNTSLLEDIYKKAGSLKGLWRVRFSDLAIWWKKRSDIRFKGFGLDPKGLALKYSLEKDIDFSGVCLCVQTAAGKRALCEIVRLEGDIYLDSLDYELFNDPKTMPGIYKARLWKMPRIKRLKEYVAGAIDWEKNTPVGELKRDTISSNLKYFLRKLI